MLDAVLLFVPGVYVFFFWLRLFDCTCLFCVKFIVHYPLKQPVIHAVFLNIFALVRFPVPVTEITFIGHLSTPFDISYYMNSYYCSRTTMFRCRYCILSLDIASRLVFDTKLQFFISNLGSHYGQLHQISLLIIYLIVDMAHEWRMDKISIAYTMLAR